jgi:predicted transcriptional regulator
VFEVFNMAKDDEPLKRLLIDESDVMKDMEKIVDKASKFFKIEKPSGRIIFQNFGALTDLQRIAIVLVGKYFASKLGLIQSHTLGVSEIAKESGRPVTTLSGKLKELVDKGFVEKLPGRKYSIVYHRINEIFDKVLLAK